MHQWCVSVAPRQKRAADARYRHVTFCSWRAGRADLVITVGKVRDADYYLAEVTADDAHDYYAGAERPGAWRGSLAAELGLVGSVDPNDFRALLQGRRPRTDERLTETAVRVTALDVTLSVPKSVSVLWATTHELDRRGIERSLDEAEAAVIALIEGEATFVRRGHAGAELNAGGGVALASFDHRTSRLADPNLHRHLVIANASRGPDDRITGLDTRQLYRVRYTAEAVFQAVLRQELAERVGCLFDPVDRHGVGEILGVPQHVRDEFSQRRKAIEVEMAAHGATTSRGARLAALTTRPAKPEELSESILREAWCERAAVLGFDPHSTPLQRRQPSLAVTNDELGFSLTERESTYDRRDVTRTVARLAPDGAAFDTIMRRTDLYLGSEQAVELRPGLYTTPEILALEARCADIAVTGFTANAATALAGAASRELRLRPHLDADQQQLVHAITSSGNRVEVVIGPPGTGKTSSLDAVRAAYDDTSHELVGAALAARAAIELEAGTQIPSSTIDRLLARLDNGSQQLTANHVLVIDEAAMVGTRQLARLITAVDRSDAKIILVGDPSQLPAIDAGGAFAAIARRVDPMVLRTNRRQLDAHERAALDALRYGDIDDAIQHWTDAGRVHIHETPDELLAALVDAWSETQDGGESSVMAAARHDQTRQLNDSARAKLRSAGELGPVVWQDPQREFAVGDRVMATENDYPHGLINGQTATVIGRTTHGLQIETDTDQLRVVPDDYIADGRLTHAYAITVHKAQGATVDHLHLLADDGIFNELGYTALSRGRHANHIHLVAARDQHRQIATDPLQDLRYGLGISRAKTAAIDHLPPGSIETGPGLDMW